MKFPIDFPPARKALGIAFVAVVAYVVVEGTGELQRAGNRFPALHGITHE